MRLEPKKNLNNTLIYVLSTISLLCCCLAGLGILFALPSYIIAHKKMKDVELYPQDYDEYEIKSMKNAKTFAMVALIINGLYFMYSVYSIATTDWDTFMLEIEEKMKQYQK